VVEVVPLTCGVDALADCMGPAGTGEVERSSTGPRAWSWLLCASEAVQMRPLGQGGRPASAGGCTVRPSAHAVGMESETKAREAPSRWERGSTAPSFGAIRVRIPALCWAGKCDG
jgi:hypothetical protein